MPPLTPHGLRRSFASLLYAIGEPPPVVMQEMGHTGPALALAIYAQAQRNAEIAEDDAAFAIDYAYGAIEEAEYAVLDAVLTRKEAEELSAGAGTRS